MDCPKAKIKFYDQESLVYLPFDYNTFKIKLSEMLGLSPYLFNSINISYVHNFSLKIEVNNEKDYYTLLNNCKRNPNQLYTLLIEIIEKKPPIDNNNINNNLGNAMINPINNINIPQISNIEKENKFLYQEKCYVCQNTPLYKVIYYCPSCNQILCENCEKKLGKIHKHAYYKIQNMEQYKNTDLISKKNNILKKAEKKLEKTGQKIEQNVNKALNKFKGVIGIKSNEQYAKLETIRAQYELAAVSDDEILKALEEANGNIDEAVAKLFH